MAHRRLSVVVLFILFLTLPAMARERLPLLHDAFVDYDGETRVPRKNALRSRFVEPALEALVAPELRRGDTARVEQPLAVQLFNDTWLAVTLESVDRNGIDVTSWRGKVEGDPTSSVLIAVKDGVMSAYLTTGGKKYEIRPTAFGVHEAAQISPEYPNELEPLVPSTRELGPESAVSNDDGSTFDILVVYTSVLRAALGGTSAAQTLATNAINATNVAYANSGVTARVRLVGSHETAYDDTLATFSTTLSRLANTSDGFMDDVHAVRNTLGADAVPLLVLDPSDSACGVGYLMTTPSTNFATNAFSVTDDGCAVSNLSFPHELGHNFGLHHDRANSGGGSSSHSFAYGYQDTQYQFRDIMAYACNVSPYCPRIQYFSNPDITYLGRALGVNYLLSNSADNVRALNLNAQYIANWRQAVNTTPTSVTQDLDGDGKSDVLWRNTSNGQVWFYKMNSNVISSSLGVYQVADTNWRIITTADMTGDGKADILWRNFATGQVYLYTMNGATITSVGLVHSEPNLAWIVLDTADLNGDAKADILYRNTTTGQVWGMLMNGATITSQGSIHTEPSANWQIVAIGDTNGDGKDDLIWRNSASGQVYVFIMNGLAITTTALVHTEPSANWQILSAADFDGDGKDDLLWRNSATGSLWVHTMNGTSVSSGFGIYAVADTNWRIQGTGDYNGDGKADILWRHASTGQVWMYLMNGATISGSLNVITEPSAAWTIVSPSSTTASSNGNQ